MLAWNRDSTTACNQGLNVYSTTISHWKWHILQSVLNTHWMLPASTGYILSFLFLERILLNFYCVSCLGAGSVAKVRKTETTWGISNSKQETKEHSVGFIEELNFGFCQAFMGGSEKCWLLKNKKKISSRGPLSWRNSMFVSCVFKRRWRLGGRKCRKMPESDICVCRKAKVVELHIVCMMK